MIDRPALPHGSRGRVAISWRFFSGVIVFSMVLVLVLFFSSDAFYVHSISVGGLRYLTKEEIFTFADIANLHVFWLDPEQVRQSVLREATVADATVYIGWPPNIVQIIIEEREPALVWVQGGVAVWIDLQGRKMNLREDRPELIRIVVDSIEGELRDTAPIQLEIVTGALQLQNLLPELRLLRYNRAKGLGYQHPNGWQVWFGVGTDMRQKVLVYESIMQSLQAQGKTPFEINISNLRAPYYCEDNTPCALRTQLN